ncbi:MAG: DoxX family protein [Planctomycetota bacterium]|jgi:uncharacterized membrane protein YphA (DoxX/SURF4 family)/polyhydroxyalkanoate synthesis regulator phasin
MLFRKARLTVPAIVFLVLLRVAIGWHFFQEGATKVRDGNFSSTPFLAAAKGPFAKQFHAMIPDFDGAMRMDPSKMDEVCKTFVARAAKEFGFDDAQTSAANDVLKEFAAKRKGTYDEWKSQIEQYTQGIQRMKALESDATRSGVESLRKQRDTVESEWKTLGRPVLAEIDQNIRELEDRINAIATDEQAAPDSKKPTKDAQGKAARKRVDFKYPGEGDLTVRQVDRIIPIFDMAVGILLLVGLLTPIAGIAAGLFLVSVVASQFPGYPGTQPTYYQAIEMLACFLVAFADAGRYAGLDFLPWSLWNRNAKAPVNP